MLRICSPSDMDGYIKAGPKYEVLAGRIESVTTIGPDETLVLMRDGKQCAYVYFKDNGSWERMMSSRLLMSSKKHSLIGSYITVLVSYASTPSGVRRMARNFKFYGVLTFSGYKGTKTIVVGRPRKDGGGALKFEETGKNKLYKRKVCLDGIEFKGYKNMCVCVCGKEDILTETDRIRESHLSCENVYTY